ncbi:hypothetical protein FSW04_16200 [Baekduia soli]|uniref:Uncharacterized protein n=1 Tax=Baekduia soli TaxID=496014 RepID=A0A5B8U7P4_9ACTN|nr:hypothetical protein [Baekduia soli]QEC48961.1 hypothetical protein FSW04_16200 [Baekduia soli]
MSGALHDELAVLDQAIAEARARTRETQAAAASAHSDAARLTEELTEAFATGDETMAAKLTKAMSKAQAVAGEPWEQRILGAERAANRAQAARDGWVAEHVGGLLAEIEPEASAATDAIVDLVDQLEAARVHWHAVGHRVEALVRAAGWDVRAVPSGEGLDQAIRDTRIALADPPRPLPSNVPQTISIAPYDDPDPDIRDAARAAATRSN